MNTLHIFDFDDTLVRSDSRVVVKSLDGDLINMTSEQFASYIEQPGDVLDFSDFEKYPVNPQIIEPVFGELRAAIALDGVNNTVILTARSNPSPVQAFLKHHRIPSIHVEAVGSSDPMAKASYILERLNNDKTIDEVRVFEDNVRNIRTIKRVMTTSGVVLKTNRVVNGKVQNEDQNEQEA